MLMSSTIADASSNAAAAYIAFIYRPQQTPISSYVSLPSALTLKIR